MDVITLEKKKVPEEKLEAFEKELTESGTPLPEGEVLAALLGEERESGIGWIEGMVPAGEGGFSHALEDCSFAKEGTITGYFCRDGLYQDADLYALDLREDEEDDEEDRQRTYVISMLREGYDVGNTAYFCGVDEAYVAAVRQELGIPEPEDQI